MSNSRAGGANTNINGLRWEERTNIRNGSNLELIDEERELYRIGDRTYIVPKLKTGLFKILGKLNMKDKTVKEMHGCKQPDESFIELDKKIIVILEKKKSKWRRFCM